MGDSEVKLTEPAGDNSPQSSEKPETLAASVFEWIEIFVFSFTLVLIVMTFVIRHSPVIGSSMAHTLAENDILLVSGVLYTPEQNDIIVFQSPGVGFDEPLVKRVIAVGGQTVDIDFASWTVTVDGKKLDESYVNFEEGTVMRSFDIAFPLTVPEGYIFVMGDNRNHSLDSRNSMVGLVDERYVIGRVIYRLFPISKIGVPS